MLFAFPGMEAQAITQVVTGRTVRVHDSILAGAEKRLLVWIAQRLPRRVNSDHLTALGAAGMLGVGACFWIGGSALLLAIPLLALNWFGDSLDGTLARVRDCQRPRYGYYVDHVLDTIGIGAIMCGLMAGGHVTPALGVGFLAAYYLLFSEIALATHARGTFRISFWRMGPTELRIVLAAGVIQLMRSDTVLVAGHRWLLFDVGSAVAIVGFLVTFGWSAWSNGRALYFEESKRL
jgi:archaetidylinositol phosphate synthase